MKDTEAKLSLHPVRMKIILLLVNGKRMTVPSLLNDGRINRANDQYGFDSQKNKIQ